MKRNIIIGAIATLIVLTGYTFFTPQELSVGTDAVKPIAGQTYTLAGSGMSSSDTSFTLTSLTITQNGYPIQDSDMSDVFYITLEPGSRARQEIISCTTVGPNTGGQVLISGCVRGLSPISPYTASTSLSFAHSGGSTVIFSDPPQLFNQATFKDNDAVITGNWLIGAPLSSDSIVNKAYVDALVSGTTTLSNDRLVVAGTAGETLATSTLVYFNPATQRWNGVSANATTTFDDRFIGLTQGAGTNGSAVTNGILLKGRHALSSGLTPGAIYYAGTATGTISTATSSQTLGIAVSATVLYFDPIWIDVPTENGDNTFSGTNTFTGSVIGVGANSSTTVFTTTGTSTWTKRADAKYVLVEVQGPGGNGAAGADLGASGVGGGGGGGGGYCKEFFAASELASTVSVFVATAGATSTFGTECLATGGLPGTISGNFGIGGDAGFGTGGDINLFGADGAAATAVASAGAVTGGQGGNSFLGGGGKAGANSTGGTQNGANGNLYGGGGGGGGASDSGAGTGGTGAQGVVIITEYY